MRITIDKAGRIVVPKTLRERYNLQPGTSIEMEPVADGIHLKAANREPSLVRKEGLLVHHGTDVVDLDVADFIKKERSRRESDILQSDSSL
jgi:AbrB family looped-hinge helix DNA binding protein